MEKEQKQELGWRVSVLPIPAFHHCEPAIMCCMYTMYSGMQEWVIQIPSIPILVSVLFPSLHLKYFRIKFLLLVSYETNDIVIICFCTRIKLTTYIKVLFELCSLTFVHFQFSVPGGKTPVTQYQCRAETTFSLARCNKQMKHMGTDIFSAMVFGSIAGILLHKSLSRNCLVLA